MSCSSNVTTMENVVMKIIHASKCYLFDDGNQIGKKNACRLRHFNYSFSVAFRDGKAPTACSLQA